MSTSRAFSKGMYYIYLTAMSKENKGTTSKHSNVMRESTQKKNHSRDSPSFPKSKPWTSGLWNLQVLRKFKGLWRESLRNTSSLENKNQVWSLFRVATLLLWGVLQINDGSNHDQYLRATKCCHEVTSDPVKLGIPHLPFGLKRVPVYTEVMSHTQNTNPARWKCHMPASSLECSIVQHLVGAVFPWKDVSDRFSVTCFPGQLVSFSKI